MKKGFTVLLSVIFCFALFWLLFAQVIREDLYPAFSSSLTGGKETFQIISADPDTTIQLVWAYEAAVTRSQRMDIENYRRIRDLSFKSIRADESWSVTEEGYLSSGTAGSAFTYTYPKYTRNVFVFCLRASGGNAIVRHDFPGGHTFYRIEGKNRDAIPFSSAFVSDHAWQTTQWAVMFTFCLVLSAAAVFLLLKWLRAHPLREPEPLRNFQVKLPFWALAAAFLIPVILALLVCRINGFVPFGNKTFLYNDMLNQNYKFILYLKQMPAERNDLFYSFSKVLGGNMLSLFSFYFNDPLYFLIGLFSEAQIPFFCTLVIVLHLGLAGLTSFFYLGKSGRSVTSALIFSCAYALMSFNIVCAENVHFLTDMVLLPLVILGLERSIRQQKPLTYVITLSISLICNVYFGYMVCLFCAVWFFFIEITDARETFLSDLLSFLINSVKAIGTAMIVILPFAFSLSGGPKTFTLENLKPEIINTAPQLLSKLITGAFSHAEMEYGAPSLFCGTAAAVFACLFFFQKMPNRKRLAALGAAAVFVLSFSVSTFYLTWHGFNYPIWWPARFAFTFGFFTVFLASDAFDNRGKISWKALAVVLTLFTLSFLIVFRADFPYVSKDMLLIDLIFVGIILLFLLPRFRNNRALSKAYPVIVCSLLLSDLSVNMACIWAENFRSTYPETAMTSEEYAEIYENIYQPVMQLKAADSDFYRVEYANHRGENPGLHYSTNSLSHFSSTSSNELRLFLDRIGFTARYRLSANYRYGSTMAADSLLGIKYIVSENDLDKKPYPLYSQTTSITIRENPDALTLGMASAPDILAVHLTENKVFENQEYLLSAVTGETIPLFSKALPDGLNSENLKADKQAQYTVWEKIDPGKPGILTWKITAERDDMLYAYFPVISQRTGTIFLNGQLIGKTIDPDNYGIIPLGHFTPGSEISVSLQFDAESISLIDALFVYEDEQTLETLFTEKITPANDIVKHGSSHLEGSITTDRPGQWLFLTIPFSDEWTIKINNAPVKAEKAADVLMAVPLEQGGNQLEMRYVPHGFRAGALISLLSLVSLLLPLLSQKWCFSGKRH